MGLRVEQKNGLFKLTSSISDERLHDEEWVTKDEAKRILINRALWDFMQKAIEIDLEFPSGYSCRGKYIPHEKGAMTGAKWMLDNAYKEGGTERVVARFKEIREKLDLDFDLDFEEDD